MKSRSVKGCFAGLVFVLVTASAGQGEQLTGEGEWQSVSGDAIRGTWTVSLIQTDDRVEGTLRLTGSNVLAGGSVAGTIDRSSIVLGVTAEGAKQATFSGLLDGKSIKGEWESEAVKDHGVWYGTLSARKAGDVAAAAE